MGGCLACLYKSKIVVSEAPNESVHWSVRRNPSVSEDFWTNSTLDMENNGGVGSQGSISSISTSNVTVDSQGGAYSSTEPSAFVNHAGLTLWNQTRQRWVGNKASEMRERLVQEPVLSANVTYKSLLGSNKPFPRPIPLDGMVQFLVEVWEREGLYG